jgi:hypothetical protein
MGLRFLCRQRLTRPDTAQFQKLFKMLFILASGPWVKQRLSRPDKWWIWKTQDASNMCVRMSIGNLPVESGPWISNV